MPCRFVCVLISFFLVSCGGGDQNEPRLLDNPDPARIQVQPCNTGSGAPQALPALAWETLASGITKPTRVTAAFDGSKRLFVAEQAGRIRVLQNGALSSYLDLSSRIMTLANYDERGLLGLTFHPDFKTNGKLYVNYVTTLNCPTGMNQCTFIAEFTEHADPATFLNSERVLLTLNQRAMNHNGGDLKFGKDGYLYIALGDEGGSNDSYNNGQDLTTLHGSVLRIDINNKDSGKEYAIPSDNPAWTGATGAQREIWAYGFRNPWSFNFDPLNDVLYVGDVGQNAWEEVDIAEKGKNYGWNYYEASTCRVDSTLCSRITHQAPIARYPHPRGAVAVTGGLVYRGKSIPDLCGTYIYSDVYSGNAYLLHYNPDTGAVTPSDAAFPSPGSAVSYAYNEDLEVVALSIVDGAGNGELRILKPVF